MKDVVELSTLLKSKISLLLLLPFWYLAIYICNKPLYANSDLILKIVICFCLSFIAEFILSYNMYRLLKGSIFSDEAIKELLDSSVIILILWLSLWLFVSYNLQHYTNYYIPFYLLILLFYFVPFLSYLLHILQILILTKKK